MFIVASSGRVASRARRASWLYNVGLALLLLFAVDHVHGLKTKVAAVSEVNALARLEDQLQAALQVSTPEEDREFIPIEDGDIAKAAIPFTPYQYPPAAVDKKMAPVAAGDLAIGGLASLQLTQAQQKQVDSFNPKDEAAVTAMYKTMADHLRYVSGFSTQLPALNALVLGQPSARTYGELKLFLEYAEKDDKAGILSSLLTKKVKVDGHPAKWFSRYTRVGTQFTDFQWFLVNGFGVFTGRIEKTMESAVKKYQVLLQSGNMDQSKLAAMGKLFKSALEKGKALMDKLVNKGGASVPSPPGGASPNTPAPPPPLQAVTTQDTKARFKRAASAFKALSMIARTVGSIVKLFKDPDCKSNGKTENTDMQHAQAFAKDKNFACATRYLRLINLLTIQLQNRAAKKHQFKNEVAEEAKAAAASQEAAKGAGLVEAQTEVEGAVSAAEQGVSSLEAPAVQGGNTAGLDAPTEGAPSAPPLQEEQPGAPAKLSAEQTQAADQERKEAEEGSKALLAAVQTPGLSETFGSEEGKEMAKSAEELDAQMKAAMPRTGTFLELDAAAQMDAMNAHALTVHKIHKRKNRHHSQRRGVALGALSAIQSLYRAMRWIVLRMVKLLKALALFLIALAMTPLLILAGVVAVPFMALESVAFSVLGLIIKYIAGYGHIFMFGAKILGDKPPKVDEANVSLTSDTVAKDLMKFQEYIYQRYDEYWGAKAIQKDEFGVGPNDGALLKKFKETCKKIFDTVHGAVAGPPKQQ